MEKTKQTAQEIKQFLSIHTHENIVKIQLDELTQQLRNSQEKDDTIEEDLQKWKEQVKQLTEYMNVLSKIVVQQSEIPLVKKIQIQFSGKYIHSRLYSSLSYIKHDYKLKNETIESIGGTYELVVISVISSKTKWMQNGVTVAGGNGLGNGNNQLSCPYSACLDDDQTIYIADYMNHRIVQWKKDATNGQAVAGVQGQGNRNGQLNYPTNVLVDKKNNCFIICDYGNRRVMRWPCENAKGGETIISDIHCWGLAIDNDEYLYVSNDQKHEVRRWKMGENVGALVAGGNGQGNRLDQLNRPYHIFVDQNQSVYVSDYGNHRVMKWVKGAREGVVVAGGQGQGNGLKQLFNPVGIVIDQLSTIYVADLRNHRVVRWLRGATEGSIFVGGQTNQLNHPWYLSFDRQNDLYIADFGNYRIQKFMMEKF